MYGKVKKNAVSLLTLHGCMFLVACHCFAGAWTPEKGNMYNRIAVNYYHADENFDRSGDKASFGNNGDFRDINLSYYMEYGLTRRSAIIGSFYYKDIKLEDDLMLAKSRGIGDIDLALKFKIIEGDGGVLSTQWLVKIPGAYDKEAEIPIGNGQYDIEVRLLYGRSLWRYLPGYLNAEVAYRWRFEGFSDEFRYLAEFGMNLTKKFYSRIKLDGIKSMVNNEKITGSLVNPTARNDFDLGKLDIALGYSLNPSWGIEVQYVPSIYGNNTAAGTNYALAVTFKM